MALRPVREIATEWITLSLPSAHLRLEDDIRLGHEALALANNSDQTPKLPDWAVVDIKTPADGRWPGVVINAGTISATALNRLRERLPECGWNENPLEKEPYLD